MMLGSRLGTWNLLRAKAICNLKFEISHQAKREGYPENTRNAGWGHPAYRMRNGKIVHLVGRVPPRGARGWFSFEVVSIEWIGDSWEDERGQRLLKIVLKIVS
jgi:hypothetical protein